MTLNEYQAASDKFRKETYDDVAAVFGLTSEAGEVAGKYMKFRRDEVFEHKEVAKELGDVLWNVAAIANDLGYSLEDIAKINIDKLQSRKDRNVLHGSGDNR